MVVISRKGIDAGSDALVCNSLEEAIRLSAHEEEIFIIGGADIFKMAGPLADKVYLTRIHHVFDGETFFNVFDQGSWKVVSEEKCPKDEKNPFDYSFIILKTGHAS
jgi:dihydrofolate reductase